MWIYGNLKVVVEYMFCKMTQAPTQFSNKFDSKTIRNIKKPLGVGLINFSDEFLKTLYDTDLRISGLKLSYSLVTLSKGFLRPHLYYPDIIYDKPNNLNNCNKIIRLQ